METTIEKGIEWLVKNKYKSISVTEDKLIQYTHTKQDPWPAKFIRNGLDIKLLTINGFTCFVVTNKKTKPTNNRIMYIHGGAYISEISQVHWIYIKNLIKETNARIYVPIYPLTNNKYSSQMDSIKFLVDLYQTITNEEPECTYNLMGDSAGGNFALILAQQIKINKLLKPKKIILLSPVVSMEITPEANKIAYDDAILSYDLLITVMKWQLQKHDAKDPLFSPIYGDSKDIGELYFFMGENEVFLLHVNEYLKLLDKHNIKYHIDVKKEMYHAYPIFVIEKNAKETNKKIFKILNS